MQATSQGTANAPAEGWAQEAAAAHRLLVVYSPHGQADRRARILQRDLPLTLGRKHHDLPLEESDDEVSRSHCSVTAQPDGNYRVQDLDSRNGIWVNGARVHTALLEPGDVLRVGRHLLLYQRLSSSAVAALVADRGLDPQVVGDSAQMAELRQRIRNVGVHAAPVLILGETGAGKEVTAQALHRAFCGKEAKPLVALNCTTLVESLAEAELFGHTRGAFHGAEQARPGLLREADGGTLFLDEIGDMSPQLQVKLLRFLEDGLVRPVGSERSFPARARIIAATNRNLEQAQAEGKFRQDLYSRLSVHVIRLCSLRERREDVLPLFKSFFQDYSAPSARLTHLAAEALLVHNWPGNVREVRTLVQALATSQAAPPDEVTLELLGSHRPELVSRPSHSAATKAPAHAAEALALLEVPRGRAPSTREEFVRVLLAYSYNVTRAAEFFGVDRKMIHKWGEKFNVQW